MYKVADVMTRDVVTLSETDDLALADTILALGRIRHLPVVRSGRLVGLVTHRDVLKACATLRAAPLQSIAAKDVMRRDLAAVEPDTPLRGAALLMLKHKYGCLPVVDEGQLVGIVTEADLVRFAAEIIGELELAQAGLAEAAKDVTKA